MDIVTELVNHIVTTQFEDIPHEVIEEEKKLIIDSLGVAIAGAYAPGCQEIVTLVKEWSGRPEASLIVYGGKVASPWAALANSTMMHALDFDDTLDDSALHAHVSVLPSALAKRGCNGKRIDYCSGAWRRPRLSVGFSHPEASFMDPDFHLWIFWVCSHCSKSVKA